jgi:hypothetical protein
MARLRPATIQEAVEILGRAWRIVQTSDLPEHVQPTALAEMIRFLAADRPAAESTPLDPH